MSSERKPRQPIDWSDQKSVVSEKKKRTIDDVFNDLQKLRRSDDPVDQSKTSYFERELAAYILSEASTQNKPFLEILEKYDPEAYTAITNAKAA